MRTPAFSVHVLTACGAALALLALIAAVRGEWAQMFLWLGIALFVDGIDGTLARAARVSEVLPRWSGDVLDLVVDFTTYVFVPAYAIAASGLMPGYWGVAAACVIVVTGALYFADTSMKTADNHFLGFPARLESGGVLSPAAPAAAVGRGDCNRGPGGAFICSGAVRASVPGATAAFGHRRAFGALVDPGGRRVAAGSLARALGHCGALCRRRLFSPDRTFARPRAVIDRAHVRSPFRSQRLGRPCHPDGA